MDYKRGSMKLLECKNEASKWKIINQRNGKMGK